MPNRPGSSFTAKEAALVQRLSTPRAVQRHLRTVPYNWERTGETLRTFRGVMTHGTAHCLEAALFCATVMEAHGFPPLLLDLRSKDQLDHVVFLFQSDGRYGTVGRSRDKGLHGRKPVFSSVEKLVQTYVLPFVDKTGRLIGFNVFDLRELRGCNWRFSKQNVWAVENRLLALRGHRIKTSDNDYRLWHQRYLALKAQDPHASLDNYPGQEHWW